MRDYLRAKRCKSGDLPCVLDAEFLRRGGKDVKEPPKSGGFALSFTRISQEAIFGFFAFVTFYFEYF